MTHLSKRRFKSEVRSRRVQKKYPRFPDTETVKKPYRKPRLEMEAIQPADRVHQQWPTLALVRSKAEIRTLVMRHY